MGQHAGLCQVRTIERVKQQGTLGLKVVKAPGANGEWFCHLEGRQRRQDLQPPGVSVAGVSESRAQGSHAFTTESDGGLSGLGGVLGHSWDGPPV